jgi:predicted RNA binding protein with dsRBD fold (UPF0201 family)
MSINIINPATPLEKADAISNLIEQMHLAFMVNDKSRFELAHQQASKLIFDLCVLLDEEELATPTEKGENG